MISLCTRALEVYPDHLELRFLRVRALMALRRDPEATRELGRVLGHNPGVAEVYRLLGKLAIRSGKLETAATFLAQAVRLKPDDASIAGLLDLVQSSSQPIVAVDKLPAATATIGCHPSIPLDVEETVNVEETVDVAETVDAADTVEDRPPPRPGRGRRLAVGTDYRPPTGRVDSFGHYLVDIGALTPLQLRAALDYQRRAKVRLGAAAVALGFLDEPSVEWAAHGFHTARLDS